MAAAGAVARAVSYAGSQWAEAREWASQVFQTFHPDADWALFDLGRIEPESLAQRIAARTGLAEADLRHLIAKILPCLQPIQGMVDLIQELKTQGRRLYYLANMPSGYADHLVRVNPFFLASLKAVSSWPTNSKSNRCPVYSPRRENVGLCAASRCSSTMLNTTSTWPFNTVGKPSALNRRSR